MDGPYFVYKHTSPDGKIYIGITKQNPPEKRFSGGLAYKSNVIFYQDIVKFGWENFKHEILYSHVSKRVAWGKERALINAFKSDDPAYGYNQATGGTGTKRPAAPVKMLEPWAKPVDVLYDIDNKK